VLELGYMRVSRLRSRLSRVSRADCRGAYHGADTTPAREKRKIPGGIRGMKSEAAGDGLGEGSPADDRAENDTDDREEDHLRRDEVTNLLQGPCGPL